MKVLILLAYYNRPVMVKNALKSVAEQQGNWELVIIDDNSDKPLTQAILEEENLKDRFKLYRSDQTKEDKRVNGSRHGFYMNKAIEESKADIGIILCDDDALYPGYINNLINFYKVHTEVNWSYSHLVYFNPKFQVPNPSLKKENEGLKRWEWGSKARIDQNNYVLPINPAYKLDSSQVSWRLKCNLEKNVWFAYPKTKDLDADFFTKMFQAYSNACFTGIIGQYKGVHSDQLCNKSGNYMYVTR